ncbi:MAG: D-alanyl-D-alanine carboxypeptidase [Clostridia bacterium]|nr:D-alanyl-D-alanine carboxypeptidase [Clostridia bacterium]
MKNIRLIALLLCVLLLFSALFPVLAAEETQEPEETGATENTEPSDDYHNAVIAPEEVIFEMPEPESELMPEPSEFFYGGEYEANARAAILIELNSNSVVYALNPDMKVYPASLTKILTCILALEYGDLEDTVTVTDTALSNLDISGSSAGLVAGEQMSLRNLLYCMMLSSANEACNVAAEYVCGDIDTFVRLMNAKAAALGCKNTHFVNTHGLHNEEHYTTVRDLSTIARYAWQNEMFRKISSTAVYTVPATNKSDERPLETTNELIIDNYTKYFYSRASGIKTGFTTPAGGCLASTAADKHVEYLSVVVGCDIVHEADNSYTDERFVVTKKLFEYAFKNYSYTQVVSRLDMTDSVPVTLSAAKNFVIIRPAEDIYALLPNDYDPTLVSTSYALYNGATALEAPVEEGQLVGELTVYYNGVKIAVAPLAADISVKRSGAAYTKHRFRSFLKKYWWIFLALFILSVPVAVVLILRARNKRRHDRTMMLHRKPGQHDWGGKKK